MTTLQQAAQAVIAHWDTTDWKSTQRTAEYILTLRKALEAEQAQAQAVEPYGWMINGVPTVMRGSLAQEIQTQDAKSIGGTCKAFPVYTHPDQQPAYDQQALELCDKCGWKGIFPGEPCFVCNMQAKAQQVAAPMTEAQIFACDPVPHEMFDQQRIDFARAIEAHHKIGAKPEAGIPVSETKVRPQNCGTGHCSCIECPYPKADWSAA